MVDTTSERLGNRSLAGLAIETDGVAVVRNGVSENLIRDLSVLLPATESNIRDGFSVPGIAALASSPSMAKLVEPILGEKCFAVRAIVFNKNRDANWKVAWHQDTVISVKLRSEMPGWGPWSVKIGVPHVRPPAAVLEKMLTVRINVDDCGIDNGPLRVLPSTHLLGVLSDAEIGALAKTNEIVCAVQRGDVLLMRPLTVHASSGARDAVSRRIVHIEYASDDLPVPLCWYQQVFPIRSR